jgi:hypothetical protein
MGLFKSEEEKRMGEKQRLKEHWAETTEHKLGISFEEYEQLKNEFLKRMLEISGGDKRYQPHEAINSLFSDLSPKHKYYIHLYSISVARGS